MARRLASRSVKAATAVTAACLGTALLAAPAQASPQPMGSGITLAPQLEVNGTAVPEGKTLPVGQAASLVFTWANTGDADVTVHTITSRINFDSGSLSFSRTGVGDTGTMVCDNPDLNGPTGAVLQPGDTVVCRSSTFTIPADAPLGAGLAGWDMVGTRTFAWMNSEAWMAGLVKLNASNGAVWRDGEAITEATIGDQLVYTFDVANTGDEELSLSAADALGLDYTCATPILAWRATTTCTSAPYTVTAADASAGLLANAEGTVVGTVESVGDARGATPLPNVTILTPAPAPGPAVPAAEPTPGITPEATPEAAASVPPTQAPAPVTDPATPSTTATPRGGALAQTGSSAAIVSAAALGLVTLGGLTFWAARRRSQES